MTDASLVIHTLDTSRESDWDRYVEATTDATFFHLAGWKRVIERVYGHACHYLYAEIDGRITGIMPCVHIKSRLFANALISTPFCVYGGAVADDEATAEALYGAACRLADEIGADYFEARESEVRHESWPRKDLYYTFRRELADNDEDILKAVPRKQRAVVRKGIKNGLAWSIDHDVDRLYPLFAYNMRELGTPVFPKRFLAALMDEFGADSDVLTVTHDGQPVASVLNFYFRDEVLPYYSGAGPEARSVKANDYLYYALMCHAITRGARIFDFGRSKHDTGPYHFKRHWGFEPRPLPYEYYLAGIDEMPDISPNNPKYAMVIKAWQRLPLPVTRIVGPWLSRDLG